MQCPWQEREKSLSREAAGKQTAADAAAMEAELGDLKRQVSDTYTVKSAAAVLVLAYHLSGTRVQG